MAAVFAEVGLETRLPGGLQRARECVSFKETSEKPPRPDSMLRSPLVLSAIAN